MYTQREIDIATSVSLSRKTVYREVMEIQDLIKSGELLQIVEENESEYDDPVDCFKCGGDAYNCHHMEDYWKEKELALKEWHT